MRHVWLEVVDCGRVEEGAQKLGGGVGCGTCGWRW
jgi:hypothetical protein